MYSASKHAVKGFTDALRVEVVEVENANVSITLIQPTAVNTPYPQHAKNYMSEEPKLPSPQIEPTDVAQATLSAATSPARDVKVGGMSKLNTTVAKLFPSLGDKMAAKQVDRQNYDEAPRNPDGTLYRAGESGRTHGSAVPTRGRMRSDGHPGDVGRDTTNRDRDALAIVLSNGILLKRRRSRDISPESVAL